MKNLKLKSCGALNTLPFWILRSRVSRREKKARIADGDELLWFRHDKLRLWYSGADVFCLASRREGWPNVLLESLACGTPVVATAVGGIPEIISSDNVGLLSEREESKLAEAIRAALKKSWRSDEIVAYARRFTWEQTALAVLDVFDSVLQGTHA